MTNIEQFNKRLGEALGLNPHGEPLYKWFHTDQWEHWMKKLGEMRMEQSPSGLFVMQPVFKKRLMCPALPNRWIIGHWHEPEYSEFMWHQKFPDQLYPARGYYVQTNCWIPEYGREPVFSENEQFIRMCRRHRQMTAQEDTAIMQAALDYEEKDRDNKVNDFLDDLLPTFSHVPGLRGGNVSYPSETPQGAL